MRVVIFGATGMIGQGVLRECLRSPAVSDVLVVGRSSTGVQDPKLREVVHGDLLDLTAVESGLSGVDACFFCLGVSSAGMSEAAYREVTFDYTLSAGRTLARLSPGSTFVYVSGAGTDSTEKGRTMWARVKGATENALLALPLKAFMMRPGYIQPMHGAKSRTRLYSALYVVIAPFYPVIRRLWPNSVTTTELMGRAMLRVAAGGWPTPILDPRDINEAATTA